MSAALSGADCCITKFFCGFIIKFLFTDFTSSPESSATYSPVSGLRTNSVLASCLILALVKKSESFGVTSTGCSISPITAGASITASGCSMPPGSTMSPGAPSIIRAQAKTRIKNKKLTDSTSLYPKYSTIPACLRHPHRGVMPALPKNLYCYHDVKGISHRRARFRENSRRRHVLCRQD